MATQQRTMVVGVDGSPASRAALRWAVELARDNEFQVAAVAVQRRTPAFMPAASMALLPHGAYPQTEPATRAERLHSVVQEATGDHDKVTEHLVTGEPARELTRMAGPRDLVVVGNHGALSAASTLLGSVTMACIRLARCPIVVVPDEAEE